MNMHHVGVFLCVNRPEKRRKKMAVKAVNTKPSFTAEDVLKRTKGWASDNWIYFIAFLIPAVLTFIAYVKFGIYPFASKDSSQGEFGSVLVLDLNGQYIYYFEALRDAFWGDGSIFYNWSRDLSGEFMGIIGYYLASPFTLIVMLLPRTMILESMMIMQICKLGTAGVTFCMYARKSKKLSPLQSLLFSTAYAMMAYAVIQLIDPMWIDGVVFLPLIALGIEYFIDDGRKLNYIIPLAMMFIANFYIGYMIAIFVAVYYFFYLFFATDVKFKTYDYVKKTLWFGISTVVVLMMSAIIILPIYNALKLGKFDFTDPDYKFQTQFSPIELIPTLLPNQYYSVNMQGKPEIYCGVISIVLLPLFYMNKKIDFNKKLGYTLLIFVMVFSMYIKPIDMMWHGGQVPNWLPYRYSFILSFVIVSIAATTFKNLEGLKDNKLFGKIAGAFAILLTLVIWFNLNSDTFNYSQEKYKYVAVSPYTTTETYHGEKYEYFWFGTLVFGMILAAIYLIGIYGYTIAKNKKTKNALVIAMTCVLAFELGVNTYDSFLKIDKEVAYSKGDGYYAETQAGRDITQALKERDNSFYRAEKTFCRTVNDNMAYGLRGITHSSSVMNAKIINFIETMGYKMQSFTTRYDGNTTLADSLLGIKYVIHDPSKYQSEFNLNPSYKEVFSQPYVTTGGTESTFHVYENPNALSIGYMVDDSIRKLAFLGNDNPFNSQNMFMSTITGNTTFETTPEGYIKITGNKEYYKRLPETYELSDCFETPYGEGVKKFVANANAVDPIIKIHFTTQSSNYVHMFLKTTFKEPVNTWISTEKDENGNFINHESLATGRYYDGGTEYGVVRVGSFEPGTDVEVRLTLTDTQNDGEYFTIIKDFFFYEFDEAAFVEDIAKLKENQWKIEEYTERKLKGKITAKENQVMLLTIPTEPGWTVKVDGKKVETFEVLKAFIGVNLTPGEHTVEASYTPPGFVIGVITLIMGIVACVFFWLYDKKNNKVLIERARRRQLGISQYAEIVEEKPARGSKKDKIIKSKGAVANVDIAEADKMIEESKNENERKQTQAQAKKQNNNKKKNKKK